MGIPRSWDGSTMGENSAAECRLVPRRKGVSVRVRSILVSMLVFVLVPASASAITGGAPDTGHPYVGLVASPTEVCSGTLLSPTVLLTAGHCFADGATVHVYFDQAPVGGVGFFTGTVHVDPQFAIGNGLPSVAHDEAVVTFADPVTTTNGQFGQLPSMGIVDNLKKSEIDLVGYGLQGFARGGGQPVGVGAGVRMFAQTTLAPGDGTLGDTFIKLHASSGGVCLGDSGGPDLLPGTNVVVAVNSFLMSNTCTGISYSYRIDTPASLAFVNSFLD
jgi:Trypsin